MIFRCRGSAGRMAIAPVLKTGVRKDLGVRIPRAPLVRSPFTTPEVSYAPAHRPPRHAPAPALRRHRTARQRFTGLEEDRAVRPGPDPARALAARPRHRGSESSQAPPRQA